MWNNQLGYLPLSQVGVEWGKDGSKINAEKIRNFVKDLWE